MKRFSGAFKDRIHNLVCIFAPGLYRVSQRTKAILAVCMVAAIITPIIFAARSCSRSDAGPTGYAINIEPLSRKDKEGNQWVIELLVGQPRLFYSSSKLKSGPPLIVSPTVEFRGREALIGLGIKGQAGERYSVEVLKNDKSVEAPKFDIVDETGEILAKGQFKYG